MRPAAHTEKQAVEASINKDTINCQVGGGNLPVTSITFVIGDVSGIIEHQVAKVPPGSVVNLIDKIVGRISNIQKGKRQL